VSVDIDIDVDTAIRFFGTGLPSPCDALHCTLRVHTRTRALKHSLLDPGLCAVEVALILDLETRAALSLHELFDCLCRELKGFPRCATATLTAMCPQECFQVSRQSFSRLGLGSKHTHTEIQYTALHLCNGAVFSPAVDTVQRHGGLMHF
jgi:hypothetical protein